MPLAVGRWRTDGDGYSKAAPKCPEVTTQIVSLERGAPRRLPGRLRTGSLALLAALLMGVGLTEISAAASTTLTFAPSADAHVRADRPKVNFGASTKLQVDNSPVFHT